MISRKQNVETGLVIALALALFSSFSGRCGTVALVAVLALTLLWPAVFTPLAWLLLKVGGALGHIMSNLVMCLVFYSVITPISLFRALAGKDSIMLRRFKKDVSSCFARQEKEYDSEDLEKQF